MTGEIEIPEGAARGQTTLAVPQSDAWVEMKVLVYEDGNFLDDVSTASTGAITRFYGDCSEAIPSILIIDCDAPTRDSMVGMPAAVGVPAGKTQNVRRLPDVRRLMTLFPQADARAVSDGQQSQLPVDGPVDDAGVLRILDSMPRVELLPPTELPTRWIDYSCFDLVFISRADLDAWRHVNPPLGKPFAIGPPAARRCASSAWSCRTNNSGD